MEDSNETPVSGRQAGRQLSVQLLASSALRVVSSTTVVVVIPSRRDEGVGSSRSVSTAKIVCVFATMVWGAII